ncbi:hypothetical protein Tco_0031188 [Tanacetum coccineum]
MGKFRESLAVGEEGALSSRVPELDRGRFVIVVKLNRGLKESNYDQLYAYLKQHEAHANENKMILERYNQHAIGPLALVSNVSPHQYPSQSSVIPPSAYVPPVNYQPQFTDNTQLDSGFTPTDDLIENLTKTVALLTQSYKTHLPQTNNQLRTSSNTRNQATVHNGRVVVQNVQGRHNRGQGNYAKGAVAARNGGAQVNRAVLDEEQIFGNVFQADQCDAFDSDVDEAPTTQTINTVNASLTTELARYKEQVELYERRARITPKGLTDGKEVFEQTNEYYLIEVIPFFKTLKEHFEGIQKALIKEVKEMKEIFKEMEAEVHQNVLDRKCDEIERKNLLIANENLIADCFSKEFFLILQQYDEVLYI